MFPFLAFRDWIYQTILFKFMTWYDYTKTTFIFNPINVPTTDHSIIPNEIMTEILLRLPPKSLSKFMCVSKSWNQLISSPDFVKNHMKLNEECSHHRVLFRGTDGNFKVCSVIPMFNIEPVTELFHIDSPIENIEYIVGSANGLICLLNQALETYIWNPTISKSKKLLNSTWGSSYSTRYGFGYDDSHDDYKAVFVDYFVSSPCDDVSNMPILRIVVHIYSLRSDSWTTVHDRHQGIFLLDILGKFVNGKVYWTASTGLGDYNICNIIYLDLADETWGSLELPVGAEDYANFKLEAVGSDLSMLLYTCHLGPITTSDVWILKDCKFWTKLLTIEYPQNARVHMCFPSVNTFYINMHQSNKGDILLFLHSTIMIYDGSTGQFKRRVDVDGGHAEEFYVESLVNPLTISDHGRHIHEASQSLC